MAWLKWQNGRQNSGYDTLRLLQGKNFDFYLLRFRQGSSIKWHVDPVEAGMRHFRLNLFVKPAEIGGEFRSNGSIIKNRFFCLFRPDIHRHSVTPIIKGTRYVLSFGFVLKEKR